MSNPASRSALDEMLCTVLAVGLVLVVFVPAARGMSLAGWLPMWLVGMPAVAWWAVRGFPLPALRTAAPARAPGGRTRRTGAQAARPARTVRRARLRAAA